MGFFDSSCGKCGSKEHSSDDCPHSLFSRSCSKCGSNEHVFEDCPHSLFSTACSKCGSKQHEFEDCPHSLFSKECSKCGSTEHVFDNCPHSFFAKECSKCGSVNHASQDCPQGMFARPAREPSSSDDDDLTGGLIKLAFVIGAIIFIFWLVFNVILPLFAINLALISLISAFIFEKYKKYIFLVSALSAVFLIFDYNYGFFTSILVQNIPFFQSWIKPISIVNLAAGLTASFFSIRDILDSRMPEPIENGTFSKRNLIVMGSLALVGSITVGIQQYVDTRSGFNLYETESSSTSTQVSADATRSVAGASTSASALAVHATLPTPSPNSNAEVSPGQPIVVKPEGSAFVLIRDQTTVVDLRLMPTEGICYDLKNGRDAVTMDGESFSAAEIVSFEYFYSGRRLMGRFLPNADIFRRLEPQSIEMVAFSRRYC